MNEHAHTRAHTHTQIHMQTQTQIQRARHTLNDPTTCLFLSFSRAALGLSPWGDINCLLPNLIRNFRRRGNLTSFLFSLARSRARCWRGSRSQDFSIHDRSRVGSNQTTGHPRSNLINLYRCVTCSSLSLSLSFISHCLFLSFSARASSSFDVVWRSRREKNREFKRARQRQRERERNIWCYGELPVSGIEMKRDCREKERKRERRRDVGMPSTLVTLPFSAL